MLPGSEAWNLRCAPTPSHSTMRHAEHVARQTICHNVAYVSTSRSIRQAAGHWARSPFAAPTPIRRNISTHFIDRRNRAVGRIFRAWLGARTAMDLGIVLFNKGPLASAEHMVSMATRAEALGFDHVVVTEHLVVPMREGDEDQYRTAKPSRQVLGSEQGHGWNALRNYHEPLVTLMFLAGRTQRIRLGTSVMIAPYRNPLVAAKMLATMDVLTGGRVFCGVGSGWWQDEFAALGLADHFTTRGSRTDEYLRIYRALWEQGRASYQGRFHRFENVEFSPKPLQQPLPIWVGGNSERALRRAAQLGDFWHPLALKRPGQLEPEAVPEKRRQLERFATEAGRDPAAIGLALRCNARTGAGVKGLADATEELRVLSHRFARNGVDSLTFDLPGGSWWEAMDYLEAIAQRVLVEFR